MTGCECHYPTTYLVTPVHPAHTHLHTIRGWRSTVPERHCVSLAPGHVVRPGLGRDRPAAVDAPPAAPLLAEVSCGGLLGLLSSSLYRSSTRFSTFFPLHHTSLTAPQISEVWVWWSLAALLPPSPCLHPTSFLLPYEKAGRHFFGPPRHGLCCVSTLRVSSLLLVSLRSLSRAPRVQRGRPKRLECSREI